MGKKILILGGAGYVGGYLVDHLKSFPDYEVTVYDSLLYEAHYLKNVNFIRGDVRDYKKLGKIINNYDIAVVLGAVVGDGACFVNPFTTYSINVESVKWLVNNFDGKILFPSTCSVYGINENLIDESAEPNPISVYAETKLEAEQYIFENRPNCFILRLGTLYGISDEHSRIRLDLVANILSQRAALGQTLKVFGGEQWRPLLHVKDVGRCFEKAIREDLSGLFNISSGNYTIKMIAEEIQRVIPGTKVEYEDISFEDKRNYKVVTDKLKATGFTSSFTLEDGIREIEKITKEERITDLKNPIYSNVAYLESIVSKKI
tara:strand:- start:17000 stop:17953 length:954 start_codon:yes stop_codon:yes gene_type:complete